MWIKDKSVYGINITRTDAGNKAVFDRTLSDEQIIGKIKTIMAGLNVSEKETAWFSEIEREVENGQTFAKVTQKIYAPLLAEYEDWTNDNAVAVILANILTDTTGITFSVEWSKLSDGEQMTDPAGNESEEKVENQFYIYVEPSMPWENHVRMEQQDVNEILLNTVRPFIYSHVHWPAEAQIGTLDCWYED